MGNLTEEFSALVIEVEKSRGITPQYAETGPLIDDTFIKEAIELHVRLGDVRKFLQEIRPAYMLFDTMKHREESMTEEEREKVDEEVSRSLLAFKKKLNLMEEYEKKRIESKKHFRFNESQSSAINQHRKGIILALKDQLKSIVKLLQEMQNTRLTRKKDVLTGGFGSFDDMDLQTKQKYKELLSQDEETSSYKPELEELSQEQLVMLQQENNEILDAKLEDLAKTEQIVKSAREIAQLQGQLADELELQSQNINTLVNEHDLTQIDIVEGNKILKKAKKRGNYATKMVTMVAIILGMILLLFDLIN